MARVFITGSSTGLGHLAGSHLLSAGHEVVLHARDEAKAARLRGAFPAAGVVVGDLERIDGIRAVAATADRLGPYRSVIHNAGVLGGGAAGLSADGLPVVFAVNALAPYLLTALMSRPERLIFLGSSMHLGARLTSLREAWDGGRWRGGIDYSGSKLIMTAFAMAVARLWPGVRANAVDPGWVPTRMGGAFAPHDLEEGWRTQVWLATSDDPAARITGQYLHRRRSAGSDPAVHDISFQEDVLALCAGISGTDFPRT